MDKKKKLSFFKLPSTRVTIRYLSVSLVMVLILASVLPIILNYPPDSLNNAFDIYMSGIPFVAQISIIYLLCSALIFCFGLWIAGTRILIQKRLMIIKESKKLEKSVFLYHI